MRHITYALITTLAVATGAIIMKEKIRYGFYIFLFFVILLVNYLFSSAEASELYQDTFIEWEMPNDIPSAKLEINVLSDLLSRIECLTPTQQAFYEKKLKQHQFDAERTWNNAKNKCWYLPNKSKRSAARAAFNATIATFGGATPMSKLVCALIALLADHGLDCIDEWYYIDEQLQWCQYHCEMVEFYSTVLVKG